MADFRHTVAASLLGFWALTWAVSAAAVESTAPTSDVIDYIVQPGDTVSHLCERHLGGHARWSAIEKFNPGMDIHKLKPGQTLRLPENRVRSVSKSAKVLKINGQAQGNGVELQEGQQLVAGTVIEVAVDSFVTLQMDDGSILVVEPNTRARLDELRQLSTGSQRSSVYIDRGRVNVKAAPQTKPGARFEITTPSATTAVRGTQFRVGEGQDKSTVVEVNGGRVHVAASKTGKRKKDAGVTVPAGEGSIVAAGAAAASAPIPLLPAPDLSGLSEKYTQTVLEIVFPPVADAAAYRVTVARDAGFDDVVATDENAQPQFKIAGLPDGKYYLRARAVSASGLHGMEAGNAFVLHARPEPPFASSPVANKRVAAGAVKLTWAAPEGAVAYDILVTRDGQPLSRVENYQGTSYTLEATAGQYLWQLATRSADGRLGPLGQQSAFTVVEPPSAPVAQATLAEDDKALTLAWAGAPGQTYHWQLAAENDFSTIAKEGDATVPSTDLSGLPAGTYFIRVRATTSDGIEGSYSSGQKFVVPDQERGFPPWILLIFLPPLFAL
ncbi:MAG: FecR domain-containing protein [Betaproteobacteria bacterium]|nr:FecR domain-containing protein [Betaproteobacteria bacterium]